MIHYYVFIYQTNVTPRAISTVIGLDEFTWRKGHTYGTIIYDFVTSKIITVLQFDDEDIMCLILQQLLALNFYS